MTASSAHHQPAHHQPAHQPAQGKASFATWLGLARSLAMYHGRPWRAARLARFDGEFIRRGDLCFDIGAHVGSRIAAWLRLGARVIAVEPQPQCMSLLRLLYGRRADVTLLPLAVGAQAGSRTLYVSCRTPTVSSMSPEWIEAVRADKSFAAVRWDAALEVETTTLEKLIKRCGEPAFCKIDVEGYELEALTGLARPLRALSFEFSPAAWERAVACVERVMALGEYVFNWTLGERHRWESPRWIAGAEMRARLRGLCAAGRSGDIYARDVRTA